MFVEPWASGSGVLVVVAALLGGTGYGLARDYCGAKVCPERNSHTLCRYEPGPGEACAAYVSCPLTTEEEQLVLRRLNARRALAARGALPRLPPAADMRVLHWVEPLARAAQRWADQCQPAAPPYARDHHDRCRNLYIGEVGQCVATETGPATLRRPLAPSMVDLWHMQYRYFPGNVSHYVEPAASQSGYFGDFAQMLYSAAYGVGCARAHFTEVQRGEERAVERLVCNFLPRGPQPGGAVYAAGAPGTSCPTGTAPARRADPDLQGLCDISAYPSYLLLTPLVRCNAATYYIHINKHITP